MSTTQRRKGMHWALPILAILVVLATLLSSATASAVTTGVAETRVRASTAAVEVLVEPPERIAAGQRLGKAAAGPGIAVATSVAANTPARFAVNSAGEATMSLRAGSASLEVTEHAAKRLTGRGISIEAAEATLARSPFPYFHEGVWKTGFYDPTSRIFLGTVGGRVTTVIDKVKPGYISNLQKVTP